MYKGGICMKRKIVKSILFCFIILVTSLQVYAASLNTNIVDLLNQMVDNMGIKYTQQVDEGVASETAMQNNDLSSYVNNSMQQADNTLKAHTQGELSRAYASVDSYSSELKTEAGDIINGQVNQKKKDITATIDNSITQAKQDIDKDFEKIIRDLNK